MDSYLMQSRLYMPVVTGTPAVRPASPQKEQAPQSQESFKKILDEQVAKTSNLSFSKHAAARVQERSITLSQDSLARLDEVVRIAREKGMDDTLIIVDSTAFIVSVNNGTVITTLGGNDLRGSAITNINGTVIV